MRRQGCRRALIVATHDDRLLRVQPAPRKVDVLVKNGFRGGLYPNSMILSPQGAIYIGMRHGVASVEKRGRNYRVDWLLPVPGFDRMTMSRERFR